MDDHYKVEYKGVRFDPYRVADVYDIINGAQFQAMKKILRAGRGAKSLEQDIDEIIEACQRWKQMIREDKDVVCRMRVYRK